MCIYAEVTVVFVPLLVSLFLRIDFFVCGRDGGVGGGGWSVERGKVLELRTEGDNLRRYNLKGLERAIGSLITDDNNNNNDKGCFKNSVLPNF